MTGSFVFEAGAGWLVEGNDRGVMGSARLEEPGKWGAWRAPCQDVGDGYTVQAASSATRPVAICTIGGYGESSSPYDPPGSVLGVSTWLYGSNDGGNNFRPTTELAREGRPFFGSELASPEPGVVLADRSGQLVASFDDGHYWRTVYAEAAFYLTFTGRNQGLALFGAGRYTTAMAVTHDGGRRWATTTFWSGPGTAVAAVPGTYLGLDYDEGPPGLVVVKTRTGQVVGQVVPSIPGGGVSSPSTATNVPTVVYDQGPETCDAEIDGVNLRTLHRQRAVPQPEGVADSDPSLSPDGRFVAFMRTSCSTGSSTLDIATTGGRVVSVSRSGYYPASTQAWGPHGTAVLVLPVAPARARAKPAVLHVVTVNTEGAMVSARALATPAGCRVASALFSPRATVIADMACGARESLVELSPRTGRVLRTLVAVAGGQVLLLGPIDQGGNALMYGTVPLTSPTPLGARWYVFSGGRSTRLNVPPDVTPAA